MTYGKFTVQKAWTEYVKQLPITVEFIYKNEWKFAPVRDAYPLVALQTGDNRIEVLLEADELNRMKSLNQLKSRLAETLQNACC